MPVREEEKASDASGMEGTSSSCPLLSRLLLSEAALVVALVWVLLEREPTRESKESLAKDIEFA